MYFTFLEFHHPLFFPIPVGPQLIKKINICYTYKKALCIWIMIGSHFINHGILRLHDHNPPPWRRWTCFLYRRRIAFVNLGDNAVEEDCDHVPKDLMTIFYKGQVIVVENVVQVATSLSLSSASISNNSVPCDLGQLPHAVARGHCL